MDATARTAELGVDVPAANYRAEWIDPKTGKVAKQERISHRGGSLVARSPEYTEDIALRLLAR